ncbi:MULTISPECIES: alternate-type signal peptide domain-containing protein [Glutamicibacter]|uniref:Alternate-type signal peptide domain-containing protein n=1 Tax=Glutamicibacter bergerei TaxID=256702 RepID=A0ABV9MQ93_9MICC|nr:hypothetical protein [Micrococcaceae bacterium]
MKKTTKATIAAVAAGALLLGGAGTVARWQATENVDAGTVATGHLTLDATTTPGAWTDISAGEPGVPFDPANDEIVPGDTLSFDQVVAISAEGKNIKGELSVGAAGAVPAELADDVTIVLDVDEAAAGLTEVGDVLSFEGEGTYNLPVKITVAFAEGTEASTPDTTMDVPVDLTALSLTLNQVR